MSRRDDARYRRNSRVLVGARDPAYRYQLSLELRAEDLELMAFLQGEWVANDAKYETPYMERRDV